jgi:hypothetical protein
MKQFLQKYLLKTLFALACISCFCGYCEINGKNSVELKKPESSWVCPVCGTEFEKPVVHKCMMG